MRPSFFTSMWISVFAPRRSSRVCSALASADARPSPPHPPSSRRSPPGRAQAPATPQLSASAEATRREPRLLDELLDHLRLVRHSLIEVAASRAAGVAGAQFAGPVGLADRAAA